MEHALERVDVENGEYLAYDRQSRAVKLQVREGTGWLALMWSGDVRVPATSPEIMYEIVAKAVSEAQERMGWFARLRKRF